VAFFHGNRSKAVMIASGRETDRLRGLSIGDSALYESGGAYLWLTPSRQAKDDQKRNEMAAEPNWCRPPV
jgi:phage gp45-like